MPTMHITHNGWVRVSLGEAEPVILAKTAELDGRNVVTRVLITCDSGLDSTAMKAVHLGWLTRAVNTGPVHQQLLVGAQQADALADAIDLYSADPGTALADQERSPLTRPDRSDPAGFYRRVADAYNDIARSTSHVAVALAAEANVPVATAHRWIYEARRRGLLAPTRR